MSGTEKTRLVEIDEIHVPPGRRPINPDTVRQIAEGMKRFDRLIPPIAVAEEGGRLRLVFGLHRIEAARSIGLTTIEATFVTGDAVSLRLMEIAENLHRAELTALERSDLEAEWIRLTMKDGQNVHPSGGAQPTDKGISRAARELPVPGKNTEAKRKHLERSIKVAGLSPEAKAAAVETGLDDNQSALLEAAGESDPARQVATIKEAAKKTNKVTAPRVKKKTAAPHMSKSTAKKTAAPPLNSISWSEADQETRRKFVTAVGLNAIFDAASAEEREAVLKKYVNLPADSSTQVSAPAEHLQ